MPDNNLQSLLAHDYPAIFYKYPQLMRVAYGVSYCNQLRKWYIVSRLHKLVKQLPTRQFSVIDVGSGEGQYLFPLAAKYPDATITGIDKSPGNVKFSNAYINKRPFKNVTVLQGVVEDEQNVAPADIVMCVGVLHFVEKDKVALRSLSKMVKPGGKLLLEVPVNDRVMMPLYSKILKRYGNYDSVNGRKKAYHPSDVLALVMDSGLSVDSVTYAYGNFGKLGHEIYFSSLAILLGGNMAERIIFSIIINLLYPITFLLYLIDYCLKHDDGNSMIVVATQEMNVAERPAPVNRGTDTYADHPAVHTRMEDPVDVRSTADIR